MPVPVPTAGRVNATSDENDVIIQVAQWQGDELVYYWPSRLPIRGHRTTPFVHASIGPSDKHPPRTYLEMLGATHTASITGVAETILADLRQTIEAVQNRDRSIFSSESLLGLAEEAISRLDARQDEDVDTWANRLAEDIRGAND